MNYYPVFLDLRGRACMIVGGGRVAERKARSLLDAGADVTVVSPSITPHLQHLFSSGKISYRSKRFEDKDLKGAYLVIAATDSPDLNASIAQQCGNTQVLVNVAAPPEASTFIVPSVVSRGELMIAISSSGSSPALAKKIRQELEKQYGPEFELFLEKMGRVRKQLLDDLRDESARRKVFQALVDSDVLDLLRQGRTSDADDRIAQISDIT